jgi:hypothetical protein
VLTHRSFSSCKGFYKLLSITFKNCEALNYFQGVPEASAREDNSTKIAQTAPVGLLFIIIIKICNLLLRIETYRQSFFGQEGSGEVVIVHDDLANKRVSMMLFKKFIAEILMRIQQYKDELLAACIGAAHLFPYRLGAGSAMIAYHPFRARNRIAARGTQTVRAAGSLGARSPGSVQDRSQLHSVGPSRPQRSRALARGTYLPCFLG